MQTVQELVLAYRLLYERGLNSPTSGNASVRYKDGFFITPTKVGPCFGLVGADLVRCSLDSGHMDASEDWKIHADVYRRTGTDCVLHAHSPYTVAMGKELDDYVILSGMTREVRLKNPHFVSNVLFYEPIVIVLGHGVYARGKTPSEAFSHIGNLEHQAKILYLNGNHRENRQHYPDPDGI